MRESCKYGSVRGAGSNPRPYRNRREFIAGLGAAAWPVMVRAQQPKIPVIGYLSLGPPEEAVGYTAAFRAGLSETGYVDGRNVSIEYRYVLTAEFDRYAELAAGLVRLGVAAIATAGGTPAALAAKAATARIPIVFAIGADPVQMGLVTNLNRPGGNVTGFTEMNTEVGPKRLALLHELVPNAVRFGVLVNPKNPLTDFAISEAQAAAAKIGRQVEVLAASTDRDIDEIFAGRMQNRIDALLVTPDPLFYARRAQLATLTVGQALPAIYWDRLLVEAGGLISYGSNVTDMVRQVGTYTGRILKGERPADLPVVQPTKFELVINLKTAKALGLTVPETLLATADEVIQ
jgi:putative ABC transport system substrate-binding protein